MLDLKDNQVFYIPQTMNLRDRAIQYVMDPEGPNWIATDSRGAYILARVREGLPINVIVQRYGAEAHLDNAKAWLHVHSFLLDALRAQLISPVPIERRPYEGRAAYLKPEKLRELWLHTNNSCNLTCTHCLVSSSPQADRGLTTDKLKNIIDQAVDCGVERFYFTGGESFVRPDIFELIDYITRQKNLELIILTNATLFQGERLQKLDAMSRDRLRLQISIDGARPETNDRFRGKGTFNQIREGTINVTRLGFPVSLTTVVNRENLDEIPQITDFVKEWGAQSQHLMWMHRRGRVMETHLQSFPSNDELISMVRRTKQRAEALGVAIDNIESVKLRINGRPFVKYDLGNQCWDSLCVYSDGTVYPSAATANHRPLAAGVVNNGNLRKIWQESGVAQRFREATVLDKRFPVDDPFKFILGGGDIEHSYFFSLQRNGDGDLHAPDPYYEVHKAIAHDVMFDLADAKRRAFNRRSGFDAPIIFHAMGDGAIACGTDTDQIDVRSTTAVATLHSNCVLAFDIEKSRRVVQEFYGLAAEEPQAELCCPTRYDQAEISHIPKEVLDRFYGCGSPVTLAGLAPVETVVDLGSGGGIDCFIAAKKVGPSGRVIGVDMTDQMLEVANRNKSPVADNLGYDVVEFRRGYLEQIPVQNKTVDLVTSNCVINLSPDKKAVFAEMWRVLKDHGRIVVSDIVSEEAVPAHLRVNRMLWGECISGALTEEEFLADLEQSGFYGLQILKKTYWKEVEGYKFFSVTARGYKFEKSSGCVFQGQRAIYLGPQKAVLDEEGHLFPRNEAIEVCTDTAAKLAAPPYRGSFVILEAGADASQTAYSCCAPGDPSCCAPDTSSVEASCCGVEADPAKSEGSVEYRSS